MLEELLGRYGLSPSAAAEFAGVSDTAVRNWISGQHPNLTNATAMADLFAIGDARRLLEHWGYDQAASGLTQRRTKDPNVANGWRLDTLIAEQRETNKILNRIEQHLAPKPAAVLETEAVLSDEQVRELKERWRGDDETVEESNE